MNKNIEAYLQQYHAYGETVEDEHYFMYREEVEGLIKLIVKDCVNIVNSLEQYEGQGDCVTAEYIKEHFGVE